MPSQSPGSIAGHYVYVLPIPIITLHVVVPGVISGVTLQRDPRIDSIELPATQLTGQSRDSGLLLSPC